MLRNKTFYKGLTRGFAFVLLFFALYFLFSKMGRAQRQPSPVPGRSSGAVTLPNFGPGAGAYGGGTSFINSVTLNAKGLVSALTTGTPTAAGVNSGNASTIIQNSETGVDATELTHGMNFRLGNGTTPNWRGARGWHWLYSYGSGEAVAIDMAPPTSTASGIYWRYPRFGGGIGCDQQVAQDTSGSTHDVMRWGCSLVTGIFGYGLGDQDNPWAFDVVLHPSGGNGMGTVTVGAGAGTGASASVTSGSNDAHFELTVVTGTTPAAGILAMIQFQRSWNESAQGGWNRAPKCIFSATSAVPPALSPYVSSTSTTQIVFNGNGTPATSTTYSWAFHCAN